MAGKRNRALRYNVNFQLSYKKNSMNKETLLLKFTTALKERVILFFEDKEMYDHKYILNSKITAGSVYEKYPVIDQFQPYNLDKLPLAEIFLGEITDVLVPATGRLATWSSKPMVGKDLNSYTREAYSFSLYVNLAYDKDNELINILSLKVR